MAVPKESRYHTIDMKAVRLSPDMDPQRMKTQLSLRAVQAVTEKRPWRMPAWIALLLVGGALGTCVWWFARWRNVQADQVFGFARPNGASAVVNVSPAESLRLLPEALPAPAGALVLPSTLLSSLPIITSTENVVTAPPLDAPQKTVVATRVVAGGLRPQSKPLATKVSPAPRKVGAPSTRAVNEGAQPASSQPKLWLE
jgi:hypothetical protein